MRATLLLLYVVQTRLSTAEILRRSRNIQRPSEPKVAVFIIFFPLIYLDFFLLYLFFNFFPLYIVSRAFVMFH